MLLALEHVAKANRVGPYEKRTLVDVSLTLAAGDFAGVWGGHRSGKSTLLRIAAGLELPDSGVVRFAGADLCALPSARRGELRLREIGLLRGEGPQSAEFGVADFVSLPLLATMSRRRARGRALDILRRIGIVECHDVKWRNLSDTERALAGLAHALVREPKLLLADDPTLGLDTLQQGEVVGLLRAAAVETGVAVLMMASTMSALAGTDAAYTLGDGRLERVSDGREGAERSAHPSTPAPGATVIDFPSRERRA